MGVKKKWVVKTPSDSIKTEELSKKLNINPFLASILLQRGIDAFDQAKLFFRPSVEDLHDPFLMKGMDVAVERLSKAIASGEKIVVYGDYDVDGCSSVSLVYSFLSTIYSNIVYYIPDRYSEGYGVSTKGINYARQEGAGLIITLDCGIRAIDAVALAKEHEIDVIICDHHLPGDNLPDAVAILDPKQKECDYPFKELCGCGVGFKLLQAFSIQQQIPIENLLHYLDFVVIATASDIVPLVGENRVLSYLGLQKINADPLPGIAALIALSSFQKELTITNIVFGIGPRINAAGRIKHAHFAVKLLTCIDKDQALQLAEDINGTNTDRRELDATITEQAKQFIQDDSDFDNKVTTVLYKDDWHKGVIGIVASRCIESYYRPTIILTESNGKLVGSARSVAGYDIYAAINECSELLEQFGGHKYAAGLTLLPENFKLFKTQFDAAVRRTIEKDQLIPKLTIDAEVPLGFITNKCYDIICQLSPFGPANMQPIFLTRKVKIGTIRLLKEAHLKIAIRTDLGVLDGIGFNMLEEYQLLENNPDSMFDVCYQIDKNEFRGKTSLQLMIKDIRLTHYFSKKKT
ncbi:MAG: single-stranded-DNA-specific exonuclease RecJ [Cyclobacteriaceae bacterium]